MTDFTEALAARRKASGSGLCVGLDIDTQHLPPQFFDQKRQEFGCIKEFLMKIAFHTAPYADCWKPNMAFYEGSGMRLRVDGLIFLLQIIKNLNQLTPNTPIIIDGKRGDIGATNEHYAEFFRNVLDSTPNIAITANPYFGPEAYKPFLDLGITIFWLVRTSNKGSECFQKKKLASGLEVWQDYMQEIVRWAQVPGQCGAVIGATHPEEIAWVMKNVSPDTPILLPGIGKQGGDIQATADILRKFPHAIANSSSAIMFAWQDANDPENYAKHAGEKAQETADSLK